MIHILKRAALVAVAAASLGGCNRAFPPNVTPPDVKPAASDSQAAAPKASAAQTPAATATPRTK